MCLFWPCVHHHLHCITITITIIIIIIINAVLNSSWELFLAAQTKLYYLHSPEQFLEISMREIEVYGTNSWLLVSIKNTPFVRKHIRKTPSVEAGILRATLR